MSNQQTCMSLQPLELLKKISFASINQKTFRIGLLQTKAYRALKQTTNKFLEPYKLSSVEWALLGLLYDAPKGMRLNVLAHELGVEAPFVTTMISKLSKRAFVEQVIDPEDNRAKITCLTKTGKEFVNTTEAVMRKSMKPLLQGIGLSDILSYLHVLRGIIINTEDNNERETER